MGLGGRWVRLGGSERGRLVTYWRRPRGVCPCPGWLWWAVLHRCRAVPCRPAAPPWVFPPSPAFTPPASAAPARPPGWPPRWAGWRCCASCSPRGALTTCSPACACRRRRCATRSARQRWGQRPRRAWSRRHAARALLQFLQCGANVACATQCPGKPRHYYGLAPLPLTLSHAPGPPAGIALLILPALSLTHARVDACLGPSPPSSRRRTHCSLR